MSPRSLRKSLQNACLGQPGAGRRLETAALIRGNLTRPPAASEEGRSVAIWGYDCGKIFRKWLFQVFNLQQMHPKLICLLGFCWGRCHFISLASWSRGNAAVKGPSVTQLERKLPGDQSSPGWVGRQRVQARTRGKVLISIPATSGCFLFLFWMLA